MTLFLTIIIFLSVFTTNSREMIIASVASIPIREKLLEKTIKSILPQIDILNVFLNNYKEIPDFLRNKKIIIARSQDFEDYGSNGKFFWADQISGYHFTIDDDIFYPKDYVAYMIQNIERYQRKVIVGMHGMIMHPKVTNYYKDRKTIHFSGFLKKNLYVNILGTGTMGYHSETIKFKLLDFGSKNMDDIWIAIKAKKERVPMVCLARTKKYLIPLEINDQNYSIYQTYSNRCEPQTALINLHMPWSIIR